MRVRRNRRERFRTRWRSPRARRARARMARVYPVLNPSVGTGVAAFGVFPGRKTRDHSFAGCLRGRTKRARRASDRTSQVYPVRIAPFVIVAAALARFSVRRRSPARIPSKVAVLSFLIGNSSLGVLDRVKYHRTPDFRRWRGNLRTIPHPADPLIGTYPENPDKTYASTYS